MIESIKEKLWHFLLDKQISLVMIFDGSGEIIWHKGRNVKGNHISTSEGFARSYILECMRSLREISKENVSTVESNGSLSFSAIRLFLKSVVVLPLENDYFLYFDSGTKRGFSKSDLSFIKTIGSLLKETIGSVQSEMKDSDGICCSSDKMAEVQKKILKIAFNDEPVLLLGETGVGKTHIAEFVHQYSGRKGEFVNADITTINENLFESTFFGHRKGAFTDAREDRIGLVEEAEGGTLFIDEISEIPLSFQSKLLRFIDKRTYRVLGENRERDGNVRIVAATNKDLKQLITEKNFKEDLYYRIAIFEITIPPLRERKADIRKFIEKNSGLYANKRLNHDFYREMMAYHWPGNMRELKTMLKRAGVLLESPITGAEIRELMDEYNSSELNPNQQSRTEMIWDQLNTGKSFWEVVRKPYLDRELNRHQVKEVIRKGYLESGMSYKRMIASLNIAPTEYKKFMNFLTVHQLSYDSKMQ